MSKSQYLQLFKSQSDAVPKFKVSADSDNVKFESSGDFNFEKSIKLKNGATYIDVVNKFQSLDTYNTTFATQTLFDLSNISQAGSEFNIRAIFEETKIKNDLIDEKNLRISADNSFQALMATETTNRQNADTSLRTDLNFEIARAQAQETVLNTSISTEKKRAEDEELKLRNDLNNESKARSDADTAESKARSDADTAIDVKFVAEKKVRDDDAVFMKSEYKELVDAERAARLAEDVKLNARCDFIVHNTSPLALDSLSEIVNRMNSTSQSLYNRVKVLEDALESLRNQSLYAVAPSPFVPDIAPSL
jgi:hypothetical protein